MNRWIHRDHSTSEENLIDLAQQPSGGPTQKWFGGIAVPALIIGYGIWCLYTGETILIVRRQTDLRVTGTAATALSTAYVAFGLFLHFHYCWGLHDRLWRYSQALKIISLLIFLPCFLYGVALAINLASWLQ